MSRTLLAFGDSHTAGAEIINKHDLECYERAYPSYIAKHYGMEYENYSVSGCSNDWLIREFDRVIKSTIKNQKKVFVLFNFCEAGRTFFKVKDNGVDRVIHFHPLMLSWLKTNHTFLRKDIKPFLPLYFQYLRSMDHKKLEDKSMSQIMLVQKICKENDIPFIFHVSCHWYFGIWSSISQKNFYGHKKSNYSHDECSKQSHRYSFWGLACNHPDWKHLKRNYRWDAHYPEEYHKYWAKKLIAFIDEQKILEGYI